MTHLFRSRQMVYMLSASLILLLFVLLFSFIFLIPAGKQYREDRIEYRKSSLELNEVQSFYEGKLSNYKELQSKNMHIVNAFDNSFDKKRFVKQNSTFFNSISLGNVIENSSDKFVEVYEVNATSSVSSPINFYEFVETLNKGEIIAELNFPVNMKREGDFIRTDFKMKVYKVKELNSSAHLISE